MASGDRSGGQHAGRAVASTRLLRCGRGKKTSWSYASVRRSTRPPLDYDAVGHELGAPRRRPVHPQGAACVGLGYPPARSICRDLAARLRLEHVPDTALDQLYFYTIQAAPARSALDCAREPRTQSGACASSSARQSLTWTGLRFAFMGSAAGRTVLTTNGRLNFSPAAAPSRSRVRGCGGRRATAGPTCTRVTQPSCCIRGIWSPAGWTRWGSASWWWTAPNWPAGRTVLEPFPSDLARDGYAPGPGFALHL